MFKKETILKIVVIFLFIVVFFLSKTLYSDFFSAKKHSDLNAIGSAIGGAIGPIIAIIAAIITYLAFIKQDETNVLVKQQFEKEQIYSRFYELLRLHMDIVNKSSIINTLNDENCQFKELLDQYDTIYAIVNDAYYRYMTNSVEQELEKYNISLDDKIVSDAYYILFFGKKKFNCKMKEKCSKYMEFPEYSNFLVKYKDYIFEECIRMNSLKKTSSLFSYSPNILGIPFNGVLDIGDSHDSFLSKYYRHLYTIVKYVAKSETLTYKEKRELLKVLRNQLSNEEQVLLYYNWLAGFGTKWESKCKYNTINIERNQCEIKCKNKFECRDESECMKESGNNRFFTDFRMIHNLREDLILFDELHPSKVFEKEVRLLYLDNLDKELFEVIDGFESILSLKELRQESCKRKEKINELPYFCDCYELM